MTVATMGQRPPHNLGFEYSTLAEDQFATEDGVVNNPETTVIPAVDIPKPVGILTKRTDTSPSRSKLTSSPTKTENTTAQGIKGTSNQTTKSESITEKLAALKTKDTAGDDKKDDKKESKKNGETSTDSHREPESENYGDRWEWSSDDLDYVRIDEDGFKHLYTDYQKLQDPDAKPPPSPTKSESTAAARQNSTGSKTDGLPKWTDPLNPRFQVVSKPKRFFAVGRIFKVPWFEPLGYPDSPSDPFPPSSPRTTLNHNYSLNCPGFHGERPLAKYRWFVVVRRRLHHSLCFSITTYAGANKSATNRTARGRDVDFVVLHNINIEPARPYEEENITRKPIAVIIEDQETFISPIARLDCGRVYTVEDHLRVMKVGRVHPRSLAALEEYFKDSVS